MSHTARLFAVAAITLLGACGKPLGTYEIRNVSVVSGDAVKKIERYIDTDPQMLRLEFTSDTDLYEASDGGGSGLYVYTSFCPHNDGRALYVGETYYNDQQRYDPVRVRKRKVLANGTVVNEVVEEDRRPAKDDSGKYVYTTYLALERAARPEEPGRDEQLAYDLRRQPRDLCLRINHPGYFITPSRSRVFEVSAALIQSAVLKGQST